MADPQGEDLMHLLTTHAPVGPPPRQYLSPAANPPESVEKVAESAPDVSPRPAVPRKPLTPSARSYSASRGPPPQPPSARHPAREHSMFVGLMCVWAWDD